MNDVVELDDDAIIARLRSALDEVTAASDGDVAAQHTMRRTMTGARRMAVAAAAVLVVAAGAAIVVNRRNAPTAEEPTTPTTPTTVPAIPTTTTEALIPTEVAWYTLAVADLVPGEPTFEPCCQDDGYIQTLAWERFDGAAYLTVGIYDGVVDLEQRDGDTVRDGGAGNVPFTMVFRSYGLTDEERETLADAVQAGSGVPLVLPVDGWSLVGLGTDRNARRQTQLYTASNTDPSNSYLPTVTLSVGEYHGELAWLSEWVNTQPVTVAGTDGWQGLDADGNIAVIWRTPDGNWAQLHIDAALERRADGIILAVTNADPTQPTVDSVPIPDDDAPVLTMPPQLEFTRSFADEFTPADVQAIRQEFPRYASSPMMTITGLPAGRMEVSGSVHQSGERTVTLVYFAGDSPQLTWSLTAWPVQEFECRGGTIRELRGDPGGCDSGIVQRWTEHAIVWDLEGQVLSSEANPIDRFQLVD